MNYAAEGAIQHRSDRHSVLAKPDSELREIASLRLSKGLANILMIITQPSRKERASLRGSPDPI